jgi:hypothetical protein
VAILVDLNGTIASEGKPNQKIVDYLKTVTDDIYIISGSHISKKKDYEALLKILEIPYVDMILNPIDQNTDIEFKVRQALTIPRLKFAIDNNEKILKAYAKAGIQAFHPSEI